jgi:hypothetical protein
MRQLSRITRTLIFSRASENCVSGRLLRWHHALTSLRYRLHAVGTKRPWSRETWSSRLRLRCNSRQNVRYLRYVKHAFAKLRMCRTSQGFLTTFIPQRRNFLLDPFILAWRNANRSRWKQRVVRTLRQKRSCAVSNHCVTSSVYLFPAPLFTVLSAMDVILPSQPAARFLPFQQHLCRRCPCQ